MDDSKILSTGIANLRIGNKIAVGFAAILLILAVSSTIAYLSFGRVANAMATYSGLVVNSNNYRDIDLAVTQYRGHVREYVFSDNEDTAALAVKDGEALHQLIAAALTHVMNPERRRMLDRMAVLAETYRTGFQKLRTMNVEQARLEADILDSTGQKISDGFIALAATANKAGNTALLLEADDGRSISLLARLNANKRLGRHDEAAATSAEQQFADLQSIVTSLDAMTKDSEANSIVKDERALIDRYQATFRQAASLDIEQIALMNGAMRQAGTELAEIAVKAKDANLADQRDIRELTLNTAGSGRRLVAILAIAALLIGAALAWLIGRGVAGPVVRMCAAMRALADGDKTVIIPGVGRKDEVGQMADTVQVFKDNMIETERLRETHEVARKSAEAERKQSMLRLADSFEAGVKGVVDSVAAQATQMQSSAQAMTHTAEQATRQATTVAAAVEQASANVQTVASAAEELSSSVIEIGRQVEQSSKISSQAVNDAGRTNTIVEGLSKTAQRIGEVVQLIESIAGQTNLLALNATIEAARAGDAGKGFAVVASEVKSLANQTAKATDEIKAQITEIQSATGKTVEAIHGIGDTIRQMNEIATAIASAVEEQGAATREIASNVQQAAQGTGDIATNIGGVSRAANETGAAAGQVLAAAGELSKQSETLRRDVDGFVATVRAA